MYKLYYAPGSAAMAIRVVLEEIGAPYELISTSIKIGEPRPAEQLAVNPNGWVPVLIWDQNAMYECAAITIFLCDRHREANLAPALEDCKRPLYLQTLVYFSNSVQTAFQQSYYPQRFAENSDEEAGAAIRGSRRLEETLQVINQQLGQNQWVLGEQFSAADIYLYMLSTWLDSTRGHPSIEAFENINRVVGLAGKRESIRRVYGD